MNEPDKHRDEPKTREQLTLESVIPSSRDFAKELERCIREGPPASWHRLYVRTEYGVVKLCRAEFGQDYLIQEFKKDVDATEEVA